MHQALKMMSVEDFKSVVTLIKTNKRTDLKKMLQYLDKQEHDIIMAALRNARYTQFAFLLVCYPTYFKDLCREGDEESLKDFRKILSGFNDKMKSAMIRSLEAEGVEVDDDMLIEVGIKSAKRPARNKRGTRRF
jgi:hypothetical protein